MTESPAQVTFLTDVNVNGPAIGIALRLGVAITRAVDIGMGLSDDSDLLDYAAKHDLVLVSGNFLDFPALIKEKAANGWHHPGVIIIRSKAYKNSVHIAEMLALYAGEDMADRVEWI